MGDAADLERPVLNPAFVVVESEPGVFQIRAGPWSGPVVTVRETDGDESVAELFGKLDGEHDLGAVLAPYDEDDRETVLALFEELRERNVLYDAADWTGEVGRPQLDVLSRFDAEQARRIEAATVTVVGVGEVGPQVAADLLRAGVGTVRLARPVADESGRDGDPLGLLARLRDHDRFELADGPTRETVAAADVAAVATDADRPDVVTAFDEVAHETGTPWLLAQVRGFDGLVGPVVFPGETACYRCFERRVESNVADAGAYAAYRAAVADEPSRAPVALPSFGRAVAGLATVDLLYLLAYGQAFTVGRTLAVNFLELSVEVNEVLKVPRCDGCGKTPGDDVQRLVTRGDLLASAVWSGREDGGNSHESGEE